MKKNWSKENILKDALKYQSRSEWKGASYGYELANKNGWLDEACIHMTGGKGVYQKGYWTLERCIQDAKEYKTRIAWRNSEKPSGYVVAKRNGWLEQCCMHMAASKKPNGYWSNFDNCFQDALSFKYLARWEDKSPAAVRSARKNRWLEQCTKHMEDAVPFNLKWTQEAVIDDAKKFQTVGEWRENSPGAYGAASKGGWLKEVTAHMTLVVSQGEYRIYRFLLERDIKFETQKRFPECKDITYLPFDFYLPNFNLLIEFQGIQHIRGYRGDKEDAKKIAKRDAIKKSFALDNKFHFLEIWSVADIETEILKKLNEINNFLDKEPILNIRKLTPYETNSLKTIGIWTLEKCIEDASQYDTKSSWIKGSLGGYTASHKNGWIDLCCEHMTTLWERKWTLEACKADALKYNTKNEWQQASPNSYTAAHRKKWLSVCSSHMKEGRKPNGYWSIERCKEDARQYPSKQQWRTSSPSGYATAKAKGWLHECCSHMM
jgi:very-short-patch-repair endonuclease